MKWMVPAKLRVSARYLAAPNSIAVWPSWPQACIRPRCCDAWVKPFFSSIGNASMSARSAIARPPGREPARVPITPVRATPRSTVMPKDSSRRATMSAVRRSSNAVSGCACRSCRQPIISAWKSAMRLMIGMVCPHASDAGGRLSGPPAGRVELQQARSFILGQREISRARGYEGVRPAQRRAAAHQHVRVAVVAEADRMAKLVRNHIAGHVRQVQGRVAIALDRDEAFGQLGPAGGERDKVALGQRHDDLARQSANTWRRQHRPGSAQYDIAEPRQFRDRDLAPDPVDVPEAKARAQFGQGAVPKGDRLINERQPGLPWSGENRDCRHSGPREAPAALRHGQPR